MSVERMVMRRWIWPALLVLPTAFWGCSNHEDDACIPACDGMTCGPDGCGGSCGTCGLSSICVSGQCTNADCAFGLSCQDRECGPDGCGGSCGTCDSSSICVSGHCQEAVCTPEKICKDRECGPDGCGGSCGTCGTEATCNESTGQCMAWRVKGKLVLETRKIEYDDYQWPHFADDNEDIPGSDIPIVLRSKTGQNLGETVTDEEGKFEIPLSRLPESSDWLSIIPTWSPDGELKAGIFVASLSTPYEIWNWSIDLGDFTSKDDPGAMGQIRITVDQSSGALYLYQLIVREYKDLVEAGFAASLKELPSIGVVWAPGIVWNCGTCFIKAQPVEYGKTKFDSTLNVGGHSKDESAWGTPTFIHEFGHYVLANRKDTTSGGQHYMSGTCAADIAWSEGFATFYSLMMRSRRASKPVSDYWRLLNSGSFWVDYAHLYDTEHFGSIATPKPDCLSTNGMKQHIGEAWVTYVLWNMWLGKEVKDENNSSAIGIGSDAVFKAIASQRYLRCGSYSGPRTVYGTDLVDFVDAVLCETPSLTDAVNQLLNHTGFPYDGKPQCSTDNYSPSEEMPICAQKANSEP